MKPRIFALALPCALLLASSALHAKPKAKADPPAASSSAPKKVLVTSFTGAKRQSLGDEVADALSDAGFEVIRDLRVDGNASAATLSARARKAKAGAVVTGKGILKKASWKVVLSVHSAEDGKVVDEVELTAPLFPKLVKRIEAEGVASLADALARADSAPDADAPEPAKAEPAESEDDKTAKKEDEEEEEKEKEKEKEKEDEEEEEKEEEAKDDKADKPRGPEGPKPSPLELAGGMRAFTRSFHYNQDVNRNLRPYNLPLGPAAFARLAWYPGAHFTSGIASHIGLTGAYEQSFAASSELESGRSGYSTVLRAWAAGLRWRLPFGTHEGGLALRYGQHSFTVEGDRDPNATGPQGTFVVRDYVPDVAYSYLRLGGDVRFGVGPIAIGASLGFRYVTSAGAVESTAWFPDATVLSGDAEIFGGYTVAKDLVALVGVSGQRYGLDMHSRPSDLAEGRDVAGGAVDQYISGWAGIEWRPGSRAEGKDAATAPPRDRRGDGRVVVGWR